MLSDHEVVIRSGRLLRDVFFGVLTTVDTHGMPHSRYMGASPLADGLNKLYTFTCRDSRKLEHLSVNPCVSWAFVDDRYDEAVSLTGRAMVDVSPLITQQVWDRLSDCARQYCMRALGSQDRAEFVVIETHVETVAYLATARGIVQPLVVSLVGLKPAGA